MYLLCCGTDPGGRVKTYVKPGWLNEREKPIVVARGSFIFIFAAIMKKTLIIALALVLAMGIFSCRKKGEAPPPDPNIKLDTELLKDTTQIEFVDTVRFEFDTINQGDKVEHNFRVKNVGQKSLLIARAFGSCGCTVPEYPKDPVKPGEIATIHVTFNSAGKTNEQNKNVTLVCNTEKRNEMLYLHGFVRVKN